MEIFDVAANLLLFNLCTVADEMLGDTILQAGLLIV
jgi:hypothetical protein